MFSFYVTSLSAEHWGLGTMMKVYGIPCLLVSHWVSMIVFLQHNDVKIPHYRSRAWTYTRGALATMDRPFLGWQGRFFLHNVNHAFYLRIWTDAFSGCTFPCYSSLFSKNAFLYGCAYPSLETWLISWQTMWKRQLHTSSNYSVLTINFQISLCLRVYGRICLRAIMLTMKVRCIFAKAPEHVESQVRFSGDVLYWKDKSDSNSWLDSLDQKQKGAIVGRTWPTTAIYVSWNCSPLSRGELGSIHWVWQISVMRLCSFQVWYQVEVSMWGWEISRNFHEDSFHYRICHHYSASLLKKFV